MAEASWYTVAVDEGGTPVQYYDASGNPVSPPGPAGTVRFSAQEKAEKARQGALQLIEALRTQLDLIEKVLQTGMETDYLAGPLDEFIPDSINLGMAVGLLSYNEALLEEYADE